MRSSLFDSKGFFAFFVFMKKLSALAYIALQLAAVGYVAGQPQDINLKPFQDSRRVLENPDKGWYHHYYDNNLERYKGEDGDIKKIPCLNHLFLRFAWAYLEPEEGKFNWRLIDEQIEKWAPRNVKISLSITALETGVNQEYATPKWVSEAGAKGELVKIRQSERKTWEPDYDDPVFLKKLSNLQKAIAERYDGKKSVATITIASIGNWGEGHHVYTSKKSVPTAVVKKHIDIYKKHFKKSLIVIGDDYLDGRPQNEVDELREYIRKNGISYRDDSILVHWTYRHKPSALSIMHPQFFDDAAEYAPTTLEMQHYRAMKAEKDWVGKNGSVFGAEIMRKVIARTQCTYLGFHGDAKEFLADNPDYAREIANKLGYWLFINKISFDPSDSTVSVEWENRGAARPYKKYPVYLKLKKTDSDFEKILPLKDADTRKFTIGVVRQTYKIDISDAPTGKYEISIRLKEGKKSDRIVELGFKPELRSDDGFYKLGSVNVNKTAF